MFDVPSDVFILDQINQRNSPRQPNLTPGDLYWGNTVQVLQESRVAVAAMPRYKAQGYVLLVYPKVDLSSIFNGIVPTVTGVASPTLHGLLSRINTALGLSLSTIDVSDINLTWLGDGESINISVEAKPTSPLYRGGFIIRYTQRRMYLADAIKVETLDVLEDLPNKSSMYTHMLDFTGYLPWLGVTQGYWDNPTAVAGILEEVGVVDWVASGGVVDQESTNPLFDRVLVQQNANTGQTIYLHYRS